MALAHHLEDVTVGSILWIPEEIDAVTKESYGLPDGPLDHPCVVVSLGGYIEQQQVGHICVITSRKGKDINSSSLPSHKRYLFLPIYPRPYNELRPDVQLRLAGNALLAKASYVRTDNVYKLPLSCLNYYRHTSRGRVHHYCLDGPSINILKEELLDRLPTTTPTTRIQANHLGFAGLSSPFLPSPLLPSPPLPPTTPTPYDRRPLLTYHDHHNNDYPPSPPPSQHHNYGTLLSPSLEPPPTSARPVPVRLHPSDPCRLPLPTPSSSRRSSNHTLYKTLLKSLRKALLSIAKTLHRHAGSIVFCIFLAIAAYLLFWGVRAGVTFVGNTVTGLIAWAAGIWHSITDFFADVVEWVVQKWHSISTLFLTAG